MMRKVHENLMNFNDSVFMIIEFYVYLCISMLFKNVCERNYKINSFCYLTFWHYLLRYLCRISLALQLHVSIINKIYRYLSCNFSLLKIVKIILWINIINVIHYFNTKTIPMLNIKKRLYIYISNLVRLKNFILVCFHVSN